MGYAVSRLHFTIEHRSSNRMAHVDGLSRYPVMITSIATKRIIQAQKNDERVQNIIKSMKNKATEEFSLTNNVLYRYVNGRYLLVVPDALAAGIIVKYMKVMVISKLAKMK